MPPRSIVIIRHGERVDHVDYNWGQRAERPHDSPLSPQGFKAARKAGRFIHDVLAAVHGRDGLSSPQTSAPAEGKTVPSEQKTTNDGDDDPEKEDEVTKTYKLSASSLLQNTIIMSSPLIRTVQTASKLADGFEEKSVESSSPPGTPVAIIANPRLVIHPESSILEPATWITQDLQRSGKVFKMAPYEGYVHESPEALKQKICQRVVTEGYSELFTVTHHRDRTTGGFGDDVPTEKRFKEAASKLVFGSPQYDDKVVVLVGHGASTTGWYHALRKALNVKTPDFDGSPSYTGFAILHRNDETQEYVDLVEPFETPHLDDDEDCE